MKEYNIWDELPLPEFRYGMLKIGKTYTFIVFNFNFPRIKEDYRYKDGSGQRYLAWRCRSIVDNKSDGIPFELDYEQDFSEKSFKIAFASYVALHHNIGRELKDNREEIINVKMVFSRPSVKKFIIKHLSILNE